MGNNLAEIFQNLKKENDTGRCAVCRAANKMDDETKAAFIDVMRSTVTVKAITEALTTEGLQVTRFQLGEARRECVNGPKPCEVFKGVQQ